jgi:hypothetical protein
MMVTKNGISPWSKSHQPLMRSGYYNVGVKSVFIDELCELKTGYVYVTLMNFVTSPQTYLMNARNRESILPFSVIKTLFISGEKRFHSAFTNVEYYKIFMPDDREDQRICVDILGDDAQRICGKLTIMLDILPNSYI